jgi:hypothetical protein
MALEGNLSAFGLSEILQLISVQQKTGMLTVASESQNTVMFFRDGQIISTRDRRRKSRDPFKDYLTRYGVLNREELIRISQIAAQSKLDLVDILASEGFMDEEKLNTHWIKQIQEAMHDMLSWDQCTYKFISNTDIVADVKTIGDFSIEAMLMESMRRIDEFPIMLAKFPNESALFTRSGEDSDLGEDATQIERMIYGLLSEILSLSDLISRGQMPTFEVYEALRILDGKGLIKIKDEGSEKTETVGTERRTSNTRRIGNVVPFVAGALMFVAATAWGFRDATRIISANAIMTVALLEDDENARERFATHLEWLIESYRAQHGVYPSTLDQLKVDGTASDQVLERAEKFEFRYRLTAGRPAYTLL